MEGHSSTGQSPQWAVVPIEEEEEEEEEEDMSTLLLYVLSFHFSAFLVSTFSLLVLVTARIAAPNYSTMEVMHVDQRLGAICLNFWDRQKKFAQRQYSCLILGKCLVQKWS